MIFDKRKNKNNSGFWNRSLIGIVEFGLKWTVPKVEGRAKIDDPSDS